MTTEQETIVRQFAATEYPRLIPHTHAVSHHHTELEGYKRFEQAYEAGFRVGYENASEWPDLPRPKAEEVGYKAGYIKGRSVANDPGFWDAVPAEIQWEQAQYGHTHTNPKKDSRP